MRPGPPRGDSSTLELTVTDEHAAAPGDGVPPVLTLGVLAASADAAARALADPHLEPNEVVVVSRADLGPRGPVPVGASVAVTATVAIVTPTGMVCEILAKQASSIVARGSIEHRVVDRDTLNAEIVASDPITR